jgi:hypothetical protein
VAERVRYALIFWETMHVLWEAPGPLTGAEVRRAVRGRIQPTGYEDERLRRGEPAGKSRWTSKLARPRPLAG